MAEIDRIIDVTITRQTTVPAEPSFDIIMIVSEFLTTDVTPAYTGRVRAYGSLSEIGNAFGTDSAVYDMAVAIFSQSPSVDQVYIGRKLTGGEGSETWTQALTNIEAENKDWYGLVVDTRTEADQQLVADWVETNLKLCGLSTDDPDVLSGTGDIAEYLNTNTLDRTFLIWDREANNQNSSQIVFDIDFVVSNSNTTTINGTPVVTAFNATHNDTMDDIVDNINTAGGALAGIVASLGDEAGNNRTIDIYWQQTEITTITSVTTGGATQPTATITYSTTDEWADCAWFGRQFPKDPGSSTWKFKSLTGVVANGSTTGKPYLTTSELNTLFGKEGNGYNLIAGIGITENGTVGSGEYIDVIRGVDWLKARIQTLVFTPLIQLNKVPYTDAGIQIVVTQLKAALQEGVDADFISDYEVTFPEVADISQTDKAARLLPDVNFTATLAGAIHKVEINGVVAL